MVVGGTVVAAVALAVVAAGFARVVAAVHDGRFEQALSVWPVAGLNQGASCAALGTHWVRAEAGQAVAKAAASEGARDSVCPGAASVSSAAARDA